MTVSKRKSKICKIRYSRGRKLPSLCLVKWGIGSSSRHSQEGSEKEKDAFLPSAISLLPLISVFYHVSFAVEQCTETAQSAEFVTHFHSFHCFKAALLRGILIVGTLTNFSAAEKNILKNIFKCDENQTTKQIRKRSKWVKSVFPFQSARSACCHSENKANIGHFSITSNAHGKSLTEKGFFALLGSNLDEFVVEKTHADMNPP